MTDIEVLVSVLQVMIVIAKVLLVTSGALVLYHVCRMLPGEIKDFINTRRAERKKIKEDDDTFFADLLTEFKTTPRPIF